jgi:hypothetical protein
MASNSPPTVQIPADAVSAAGKDLLAPLTDLLGSQGLNIQGSPDETKQAGGPAAAIGGPPQSVAIIEAGATAVSKWWSAGLGATVAATWASVASWWDGQNPANQRVVLWGAAIITAAAFLGIAYLLASDVRGRAAGAVATIQARAQVAERFIQASQAAFVPTPPAPTATIVSLPQPLDVNYTAKPSADEGDWRAVAVSTNGEKTTKYLIAKGAETLWADASQVSLVASPNGTGGPNAQKPH